MRGSAWPRPCRSQPCSSRPRKGRRRRRDLPARRAGLRGVRRAARRDVPRRGPDRVGLHRRRPRGPAPPGPAQGLGRQRCRDGGPRPVGAVEAGGRALHLRGGGRAPGRFGAGPRLGTVGPRDALGAGHLVYHLRGERRLRAGRGRHARGRPVAGAATPRPHARPGDELRGRNALLPPPPGKLYGDGGAAPDPEVTALLPRHVGEVGVVWAAIHTAALAAAAGPAILVVVPRSEGAPGGGFGLLPVMAERVAVFAGPPPSIFAARDRRGGPGRLTPVGRPPRSPLTPGGTSRAGRAAGGCSSVG